MQETGQEGPIEAVIVHLGYNELYALHGNALTDATWAVWQARIDAFLEALQSPQTGYPGCKVVLALPSSGNASQAAWDHQYANADINTRVAIKCRNLLFFTELFFP